MIDANQNCLLGARPVDVEAVIEHSVSEAFRVRAVTPVHVLLIKAEHDEDAERSVAR